MTTRPVIPVRVASGKPSAQALANMDKRWRVRYLMLAPHRLGFFLAMVVLVASGLWWALVQLDRSTGWLALPSVISPTLVHSAVMAFGFIPLFFSGFLFTAGPKWLGVEAPLAKDLRVPLFSLAAGWLLWLAGAHLHAGVAWAGLALAMVGLVWMTVQFWGRIRRSQAEDQLHARVIGTACVVGCVSLAGLLLSLVFEAHATARAWIFTGLWGFVVVVYVTVAHRMIPFFTSSAMPMVQAWRPFWVLWLMLAAAALQVLAAWLELAGVPSSAAGTAWLLVHGTLQLMVGGVLVWLAWVWAGAKPEEQVAGHVAHRLSVAGCGVPAGWGVAVAGGHAGHGSAGTGSAARADHGLPRLADAGHGHACVLRPQRPRAGG